MCFVVRQQEPFDPTPKDRLPYGGTWEGLVGVPGGIPNRTTIAQTIQPYTGSAATINTALANCPAGQVVQLAAGTFNINETAGNSCIQLLKDQITLRGSVDANGVPTTILNFTGTKNMIQISDWGWDCAPTSSDGDWTRRTVASGAVRGSNQITLTAAPTGLAVNMLMFILHPPTTLPNSTIRGADNWAAWNLSGSVFSWSQVCRVLAINGSTVTFMDRINADYLTNAIIVYRAHPNGTQCYLSGIENLDLQCGTNGNPGTVIAPDPYIKMTGGADSCWLKNIKAYWGASDARMFFPIMSFRCEMRHCEFQKIQVGSSGSDAYTALSQHCTGLLFEDNYFHNMPNVMPMMGVNGSAFAYNLIQNEIYAIGSENWQSQIVFFHGCHAHYNLFEGNWGLSHYHDGTETGSGTTQHAHSRNTVFFRERLRGWDANPDQGIPKTSNIQALSFEDHHDNVVIAGCVLGEDGKHTTYLGGTPNSGGDGAIIDADATTKLTWQRTHNYNTVNDAVPAAEALKAHQALPASYLHSTKPSWWGRLPWPWCEPSNFTQSNTITNFPAGYRATNGVDP